MGNKMYISEEQLNKMVAMYNEGDSYLKISKEVGIGYHTVLDRLKSMGCEKRDNSFYRKRESGSYCNTEYFDNINTEDKAYWLGFIWADGYLAKTNSKTCPYRFGIAISDIDYEHLELFKKHIESTHKIATYDVVGGYKVGATYCRFFISENKISNALMYHGIAPNKSKSTDCVKLGNFEYNIAKHIIRGYADGNGSYRESGGYYKFDITGNKESLCEIDEFFKKYCGVNFKWGERHPERDNNNYTISVSNIKDMKKITDILIEDAETYLKRKNDKMLEFLKKYNEVWRSKYE